MEKRLPTPKELRTLLDYNPETGALTWRARDASMFVDSGKKSAEWTGRVWNARFAGSPALACRSSNGYLTGSIGGVGVSAHRAIWAMLSGHWPTAKIDHINGDRSDNRAANLRCASDTENSFNRGVRRDNALGIKGVHRHECGRFCAQIQVNGRKIYLGLFGTAGEAAAARIEADKRHFGDFRRR